MVLSAPAQMGCHQRTGRCCAQRAADKRTDGLDSAEDGAWQEDGKLGPSADSTDLFSVWRSGLPSSALWQ